MKRNFNGDEATDFHDEEIPKVGSNYTCLTAILYHSVLKKDENYYPQKTRLNFRFFTINH